MNRTDHCPETSEERQITMTKGSQKRLCKGKETEFTCHLLSAYRVLGFPPGILFKR